MVVKYTTLDQCQWMHQKYAPPDCCLCNSRSLLADKDATIARLEQRVKELDADLAHFMPPDLKRGLAEAKAGKFAPDPRSKPLGDQREAGE